MNINSNDKYNYLPYKVGALLYTPALNKTIIKKIINNEIEGLTSLAFCLEDTIQDECLEKAEKQLKYSLTLLEKANSSLPLLFIRVRSPLHLKKMHDLLKDVEHLLTGYILPKFDTHNCVEYCEIIKDINKNKNNPIYMMPILESEAVVALDKRVNNLLAIKESLVDVNDYVLNIRVGGNDLSNMFGVRRTVKQNIYDIGVIRDVLINIINVFATEYVVSAPVWEYFGSDSKGEWLIGLKKELELDRLNGFIGKTAIHPSQLPVINESLKVSLRDYNDAKAIMEWETEELAVAKGGIDISRMNEKKTHKKWAERVLIMAKVFGINNSEDIDCNG